MEFYLRDDDIAYDSDTDSLVLTAFREQIKDIQQEIKKPKFKNRWLMNYNLDYGEDSSTRHMDLCYLFDSFAHSLNECVDMFRVGEIALYIEFNRYFDI